MSATKSLSNGASRPVRLRGAWARLLNGRSSNSRCAVAPSSDVAVMPAIAGSVSSQTAVMMLSISRRLAGVNSAAKLCVLHVAAGERAEAGAGDAEGVAAIVVVGQHKNVAEQFAHRGGFDIATVGRATHDRAGRPNRRKTPGSTDVSCNRLASAACLCETLLSRFRASEFPSQLCGIGFAASMPGTGFGALAPPLCAVNVKLTMRLGPARNTC